MSTQMLPIPRVLMFSPPPVPSLVAQIMTKSGTQCFHCANVSWLFVLLVSHRSRGCLAFQKTANCIWPKMQRKQKGGGTNMYGGGMVEVSRIPLITVLWAFTWCVQPRSSHLLFLLLQTFDFSSSAETHELSEVGIETRAP